MNIRLMALLVICVALFSGCHVLTQSQVQTHFSDSWRNVGSETSSDSDLFKAESRVVEPSNFMTPRHEPNPDKNPHYILTSSPSNGHEYLLEDSVRDDNGTIVAWIEFRYLTPQTLPEKNLKYFYNRWYEQIDCEHKVRILRATFSYDVHGEVVDAHQYTAPAYSPEQLQAIAQPNDGVIRAVCQHVEKVPS